MRYGIAKPAVSPKLRANCGTSFVLHFASISAFVRMMNRRKRVAVPFLRIAARAMNAIPNNAPTMNALRRDSHNTLFPLPVADNGSDGFRRPKSCCPPKFLLKTLFPFFLSDYGLVSHTFLK